MHTAARIPLLAIGVATLSVAATLLFFVRPTRIGGESMSPTLHAGDVVLVWIGPGVARRATAGSVVVARVPSADGIGQDLVVKRVAAIDRTGGLRRFTLAGDNAGESRDSRHYGALRDDSIAGVVWLRLYPRPGPITPADGNR